jgi:hypothetical protein
MCYTCRLNTRTGVVSSLVTFDAEQQRSYVLIVSTDEAGNSFYPLTDRNAATITVNIVDKNDYIPTFDSLMYTITVADYTAPGTAVFQVTARDQDATVCYIVILFTPF